MAVPEGDQTAIRVVGRNSNDYAVAEDYADTVAAHFAAEFRNDLVSSLGLDAEQSASANRDNFAFQRY